MKYVLGVNYVLNHSLSGQAVIKCNRCQEHVEISSTKEVICQCGRKFTLEPKLFVYYEAPYDPMKGDV